MTDRYHIGLSLVFKAMPGETVDFDDVTNRFYDELLNIEESCTDIHDPDLSANLENMTAVVELLVDADQLIDAQVRGISAVRTALHTIEVATPGWEAIFDGIVEPTPAELLDA
jgi:hypothetical protein